VSDENKHKDYSAADIEKYHKGLLSPKEMNDLEKAALEDPFLADAIEGYADRAVQMSSDLTELKKRLEEKVDRARVVSMAPKNSFKWWRVAAAVIVLGGIGFLGYRLSTRHKNNSIAVLPEKKSKDSSGSRFIDSQVKMEIVPKAESTESKIVTVPAIPPVGKHSRNKRIDTSLRLNSDNVASVAEGYATANMSRENDDSVNIDKSATAGSLSTPMPMKARSNDEANALAMPQKKSMSLGNQQHLNYFHGRVLDASNNPLPFANVTSTRYNVGTYADAQGNFTLISADSLLDVQVRSVGFENGYVQLKNNVPTNKIILNDDKTIADRVISYQKPDTSLARGTFKLEEPEPADGWSNYDTYLANNINVPDDLKLNPNKGQVELSFDVTKDGDPVNFKVEKSLCQKCDEEAIRLIKEGPKWKKKSKKAKRVTVMVPFSAQH